MAAVTSGPTGWHMRSCSWPPWAAGTGGEEWARTDGSMTCILPRFIEYNTAPFRLAEASLIVPDFSIFVYTAVLVIISFSASFSQQNSENNAEKEIITWTAFHSNGKIRNYCTVWDSPLVYGSSLNPFPVQDQYEQIIFWLKLRSYLLYYRKKSTCSLPHVHYFNLPNDYIAATAQLLYIIQPGIFPYSAAYCQEYFPTNDWIFPCRTTALLLLTCSAAYCQEYFPTIYTQNKHTVKLN